MSLKAPVNKNYCAVVVSLKEFVQLPNCDNVQAAIIFNNSVIVSKSAKAGDVGVFFPVETQLSKGFLGNNNLFRKPEWGNSDQALKGFFEESGRVKAVKFRGHKSEGFFIPINSLDYALASTGVNQDLLIEGAEFESIGAEEICCKYVPQRRIGTPGGRNQAKQVRVEDRILDGQFRFHYDTENLRRNIHKIQPDDFISISDKWHGTSAVFANILVDRPLNWIERILDRLGVAVQKHKYGIVWSSRRVVKGVDSEQKPGAVHFYESDIWGAVAHEIQGRIPKGFTLYGEIVGFTSDGGAIQKGYHYGCQPKQHSLLIYRVTMTSADGMVLELPWLQMLEFCAKYGFDPVKPIWYGRARDFSPIAVDMADFRGGLAWQEMLLRKLEADYVTDQQCAYNDRAVPAEGIVVRIDRMEGSEAFKLKNFSFLKRESDELDKGTVDIETEESAPAEVA